MSESNLSTFVSSGVRWPLVVAAVLLALSSMEPMADENPSNAEGCSFDVESLAVVRATRAVGNDLEVVVDWKNDATALPANPEIRLFDGDGNLVTSRVTVPIVARRTTTTLVGALANVLTTGFQYHIEVTDSFGFEIATPHHFRVALDCSGGPACGYQTIDGLRAGPVSFSKELMALLDELDGLGSNDVLGDAIALRPWLLGDILTLGEQLSDLDEEYDFVGCVCFWTSGYAHNPEVEESLDPAQPTIPPQYPDFETGGSSGPGAEFAAGLQMIRGAPQQLALGGRSELTMDLRCWDFTGWQPETVPRGASIRTEAEIRLPIVKPCDEACEPEIRNRAELWGKLDVEAYGTLTVGGSSEAYLDAFYYLLDDNQSYPQFSAYSVADVQAHAQGTSTDLVCTHKAADQTFERSRIDAILETSSLLEAAAGAEGYSVVRSRIGFWMEATGFAECAIEPNDRAVWNPGKGERDDGLEIDLWGYPR